MKTEIILNGTTKVVLIPETEIEKLALELLGKQEIEGTTINSAMGILDKKISHGLIIQNKTKVDENS
jgi:hypothetical protein